MAAATNDAEVTDAQLAKYAKLIYQATGIVISPKKKQLLSNRVRRRLRATGIRSFEDYFVNLCGLPITDPEWDAFLQEITTHETYLLRDESNWDWFRDTFIPEIARQARAGERKKSLRIWSAACSTGDEACTIAICIADRLMGSASWDIQVLGTDIGVEVVNAARAAKFSKRAMQHVPDSYRTRYFTKEKDAESWTAKKNVTQWMKFYQHNLLEPLKERPFDLVFLKNVLIYFDQESKKIVLNNLSQVMRPGATLITGAAEGVVGLLNDLQREAAWRHTVPSLVAAGTGATR
jgi:chemotaxis protein methyltransferase CheR